MTRAASSPAPSELGKLGEVRRLGNGMPGFDGILDGKKETTPKPKKNPQQSVVFSLAFSKAPLTFLGVVSCILLYCLE